MSGTTPTPTRTSRAAKQAAGLGNWADQRYRLAAAARRQMNKVFPTHWSFLLGEIALYTFILLLLSGTYLTLFFDPSMQEVTYHGSFQNLQNVQMSRAFASTLDISFDVRGGLFVRQVHHWAALLFIGAMMVHMFRIFFTGAFRRPRETNWVLGATLLIISLFEGFFGYSLPDDLLSGTGIRATLSGIVLSIPLIGTWVHWALFGGLFPGNLIVPRMYALHILLLPGIILGLISVHLALVWYQKHTQFPGVRRTERNVVGIRIMPLFAVKGSAWFAVITGIILIMAGVFQINPVWNYGPYVPSMVSAGSQPDWYLAWSDGLLRIWPPWELYLHLGWLGLGTYTVPAAFFPAVGGMTVVFTLLVLYPFIERRLSGDTAHHNLLQRPRDVPVRTALGAMAIAFWSVAEMSGFNDIIADQFNISLNAMTWIGRIGILIAPPIAYWVTYRACIGLQRADREVLAHGIETGIIKRLPHGEFIEVHQPLGAVDGHGHPVPLPYQGSTVPKKMNKLGLSGHAVAGTLFRPDPAEETAALEAARAQADREAAAREEVNARAETGAREETREPSHAAGD